MFYSSWIIILLTLIKDHLWFYKKVSYLFHRYPENLYHFFAFRGNHSSQEPSSRGKEKQKYNTIRGFASKTLKNVSRAAGIKSKPRKSSKYLLPNMMPGHGRLSIPDMTNHESRIREEDEDSQAGDIQSQPSTPGAVNLFIYCFQKHEQKIKVTVNVYIPY
jgi:hypothetical protein